MTSDSGFSSTVDQSLDWNLRLRVTVPDPVPGYFDRPALIERLISSGRNVAVLRAPGGYGKTTLLAAYCRQLVERGLPAAWLQVDAADDRSNIEDYLALVLHKAGVDIPEPGSDAWSAAGDRVELILGSIANRTEPCTLVLDNLERLTDPGSADVFNKLLRNAPPTFHMVMACRELPLSLDIAMPLLDERAVMLTAGELRFSSPEAAAFLGRQPTSQELTAIDRQFEGWPVALALHRKAGQGDSSNLLGNWIESRLLEHLSAGQRDFLLDAGLLDSLDPVLLDDVLNCSDSRYRLRAMPEFDGLIRSSRDNGPGATVLHPLLRRHSTERRIRETPQRYRLIHHRAALAHERRGETFASLRHATEAGDSELLGRLIEDAGGPRLWLGQVSPPIEEISASLTHDVIKRWPRLALTQCYILVFADRIPEACRLYDQAATSSDGFTRNPTGDIRDLRIDKFVVEIAFFLAGYTPVSAAEFEAAVADAYAIARDDDVDPATRALLLFGLCIYENRRARFDALLECVELIRQFISDSQFPYLANYVDIQSGCMAMAQGHVQEAETCFTTALQVARTQFTDNPVHGMIAEAVLRDLQFERNRLSLPVAAGMCLRDKLTQPGNTFATHASECAIVLEITQYEAGVDEALAVLTEMTEYARVTRRQTLVRYLAALRVATLAGAGRVTEAERAWRAGALPSSDAGCLDMQALEWREMETIACARLRLYAACGEFEAGREFTEQLLRVAGDHELVRTQMRVYAISMALERRAGDMDAACAHLESFLQHYITADYARPILREGDAGREVLKHLLGAELDGPTKSAASDLLRMLDSNNEEDEVARITDRELAVLNLLPDLRDKQIAAELSISRDGVRYHLGRIFAKLGVRGRREAVKRAQSIGLLPH